MSSPNQRLWHHNTRRYTLLEYASLKQACPEGIYLNLKPANAVQWSGVLFVRKGPYAPAILRFLISFPPDYPTLPPSITFVSNIFHPLVTPLTTYTYTTGSSNQDTVSATDDERLPPGGFNLRHGFPHWFQRAQRSATSSTGSSRQVSDAPSGPQKFRYGKDAYMLPPADDTDTRESSTNCDPALADVAQAHRDRPMRIFEVLQYVKRAFDDEAALDNLPLEVAGNSGAWKAWRAYRMTKGVLVGDAVAVASNTTQQEEWSWDGVWEERVRKGIDASIAEPTLYGGTTGGDDLIRFVDVGDDVVQEIKECVLGSIPSM